VANIKSQKKRNLTNEKARLRNKSVRSSLKTETKKVLAAIEAGDKDAAVAAALVASKALDVAASKGVIHKNQAANRKSGLMKAANAVAYLLGVRPCR
jgi:small subunit ribosomal protein S20